MPFLILDAGFESLDELSGLASCPTFLTERAIDHLSYMLMGLRLVRFKEVAAVS